MILRPRCRFIYNNVGEERLFAYHFFGEINSVKRAKLNEIDGDNPKGIDNDDDTI